MNPSEFIAKGKQVELRERSAAQQHFPDLCDLLGHPKPAAVDHVGDSFTFERGASKLGGGDGWADVWKWLDQAHRRLDEAVFAAYGWSPDLSDEDVLAKLLELNLARAVEEGDAAPAALPGEDEDPDDDDD